MRPTSFNNPTRWAPVAAASGDWKANLRHNLRTPEEHRSLYFSVLISELLNNPQAAPQQVDLSAFVVECMFLGETAVLIDVLPQVEILHIDVAKQRGTLSMALETLLEVLEQTLSHSHLTELSLTGLYFDRNEIGLLLGLLSRMPKLRSLHIQSCKFDVGDPLPRCADLAALKSLYLGRTQGALPVLEKILAASQLEELHIGSNRGSTEEQHTSVAKALANHATLVTLELSSCAIRPYCEYLKQQTTLQDLFIFNIQLSDEDCSSLHHCLQDKSTLTRLSLSHCWPTLLLGLKAGAPGLARLLQIGSLVELDLSENFFFNEAAPVLGALADHPKLKKLSLDRCNLGNEVFAALAGVCRQNDVLTSLTLPNTGDHCLAPLVPAMKANTTLRFVSVPFLEELAKGDPKMLQWYPNYSALVKQASFNCSAYREGYTALMAGGMKAVLAGLGGVHTGGVPSDIAEYATDLAVQMHGQAEFRSLPLLSMSAHAEGLAARDRLWRRRQAEENAMPAPESDKN